MVVFKAHESWPDLKIFIAYSILFLAVLRTFYDGDRDTRDAEMCVLN